MGTTAEKLQKLVDTKEALKSAINGSGSTVGDVFSDYATAIADGKSAIAAAITGKGVTTNNTDTFSTMAGNISSIQSGAPLTELTINAQPASGYVTAVTSQSQFSTALFGDQTIDCTVGEIIYVTAYTLTDFVNCEEVSIQYGGYIDPDNALYKIAKLVLITGKKPSFRANY